MGYFLFVPITSHEAYYGWQSNGETSLYSYKVLLKCFPSWHWETEGFDKHSPYQPSVGYLHTEMLLHVAFIATVTASALQHQLSTYMAG